MDKNVNVAIEAIKDIKNSFVASTVKELKSVGSGLKTISRELSRTESYLIKTLESKGYKKIESNLVLKIVCGQFNISTNQMLSKLRKPHLVAARNMAYQLLHYELNMTIRHISNKIFHSPFHNKVGKAVVSFQKLNPKLKQDMEYLAIYNELKQQLQKKLSKKNESL